MSPRIPPQPREWINRRQPLQFRFEGRDYSGFAGDTITSALWASGVRMLGRSFKYHRPRGVLSLANHDVNNIVLTRSATNIRADVTPLTNGAEFFAVNTFGGLERDSARYLEWFSKMLPVGFYYKAFHTPRRLFPFYERKMREMAGLGAVDPKWERIKTPKAYDYCDVVVIGAGPAGLAAAIAAGETGARVLLVDENPAAGGSLGYQYAAHPTASAHLDGLLTELQSLPTVRVKTSSEAAGYYADHWIALVDAQRLTKLRAQAVVIASGVMEQPAVFHNNDLPGVMLASAAQRLMFRFAVKPFDRAVVLAANSDAYRAALDLHNAGVVIAAIVDLRDKPDSSSAAQQLSAARVPVYQQHTVYDARAGRGKKSIVGAVVCPLNSQGQPIVDKTVEISCDGIAMSVGWMPCDSLINQAAGKMSYSERLQQFVPHLLPPGIFAAGRVNGIYDLDDQISDGRRAGLLAASHIGRYRESFPSAVEPRGEPSSHAYPIFPHPKGKEFIDFDEDVQVNDIKNAVQEGFDSIELIKRYTTLGMGPSQGKVASMNGVRILANVRGQSIDQVGTTTSRPFYHPVPFAHLAGRNFHPVRHTAMHSRHEQAGAVFMPAGVWRRPAYYAPHGRSREEAIQVEVDNVRQRAGLIDVGTLGKIEVNGRDAAEFLERTYTGRFANMKLGTTRYLLMCDESGVVVDDGVAARIAQDRFYVTATTTGADAVYREMQRNVLIWGLDVVLINLTGTYTAMNLAGPSARRILTSLTEIKLDQTDFPYLGLREGIVAGAPARVLRVGFVGEWGYEIHVPSQFGPAVWDQILQAGQQHGIRLFGVEAQRILRLEKAHIIIGQDTDGLTNPFEAGLEWAVKMDKPFFIGQRSLRIIHPKKKPIRRTLAGFKLTQNYSGPAIKECHLVIQGSSIAGRVTSVAFSPTLRCVLGLAFVLPEQSKVGSRIRIRTDDRSEVEAEVTQIPFYDPDSRRQHETSVS